MKTCTLASVGVVVLVVTAGGEGIPETMGEMVWFNVGTEGGDENVKFSMWDDRNDPVPPLLRQGALRFRRLLLHHPRNG
jgi:hypothetical protein